MKTQLLTRVLLLAVLLTLGISPGRADADAVEIDADGNTYSVEFLGVTDHGDGTYTWSYEVKELAGKDLSHWTLALCFSLDDVVGHTKPSGATAFEKGTDPTTGVTGVKWEVNDDFEEGIFTITVDEAYAVTTTPSVSSAVKTGGRGSKVGYGLVEGPDCTVRTCDATTGPSWDGNFTVDAAAHTGSFSIETPNGFQRIELLLAQSSNIALVGLGGVDAGDVTPSGPLAVDAAVASGRSGYTAIEYDGAAELTSVVVQVTPRQVGGSRFMFRVTDRFDCTAQIDPVVELAVPAAIALEQNYPNPANPETTIRFTLPEATNVRLAIYDVMGREVKTLVSGPVAAGAHEMTWDGTDAAGVAAASGVYLYRLEGRGFSQTRQLTLLK